MQEWLGRLEVKAADCKYKEKNRTLKEQFISDINDEAIRAKIIKELIVLNTPVRKAVNKF